MTHVNYPATLTPAPDERIVALLIPADSSVAPTLVSVAPTPEGIRAVIGGGPNANPWSLDGHNLIAHLGDTGKGVNAPANARASHLGVATGSIPVGESFAGDVLLSSVREGAIVGVSRDELAWATEAIAGLAGESGA